MKRKTEVLQSKRISEMCSLLYEFITTKLISNEILRWRWSNHGQTDVWKDNVWILCSKKGESQSSKFAQICDIIKRIRLMLIWPPYVDKHEQLQNKADRRYLNITAFWCENLNAADVDDSFEPFFEISVWWTSVMNNEDILLTFSFKKFSLRLI